MFHKGCSPPRHSVFHNKYYMRNLQKYIALTAFALPMAQQAQTVIGFEDESQFKSIGVYDSWAHSPFRTGALKGNVQIVDNDQLNAPDAETGVVPNGTAKLLAFQRSRFAGNLFGARIDLKEPIKLTPKKQFVHVMIHKEKAGRVMLIGLGKRPERVGQKETEQFTVLSSKTITPGKWQDAVFAINGAEGAEVNALVVVPDCESTHNLAADFAAYIDEIEVNSSGASRIVYGIYPINFPKNTKQSRSDRYTSSIGFSCASSGKQTIAVNQKTTQKLYTEVFSEGFCVKPGESVTPTVNYTPGTWMHSYVYLDKGNDGRFDVEIVDDGTLPEASDLVSYSYYEGKNSLGASANAGSAVQPPSFTIPADMKPGFYRLRYKVDWNSTDAGGNDTPGNLIAANGGVIVDTRLNVHNDMVTIYRATAANGGGLNGDILKADGTDFTTEEIPFGKPYTIKAQPAPGFVLSHVVLRHGYGLDGDSLLNDTPQYEDVIIPAYLFKDGAYTIPAEYVDGTVRLIPYFSSRTSSFVTDDDYGTHFDKATATVTRTDRRLTALKFIAKKGGTSTLGLGSSGDNFVYRDMTKKEVSVLPGDEVKTTITYRGKSMQAYLYIDFNQDGQFDAALDANGQPTPSSELIAYNYFNGRNSDGKEITADPADVAINTMPAFRIPEMLPTGNYRARLKVDFNNIDPAGQWAKGGENNIDDNGGNVVDFLLNVHNDSHKLDVNTVNGSVHGTAASGLPPRVKPFTALAVRAVPVAEGYKTKGMVIRHGHNLNGPQYIRGNRQWSEYTRTAISNYSIPKDSVNGDVEINVTYEPTSSATYELVFADEFNTADGTQPNDAYWTRCTRQSPTWKRFLSKNKQEHELTGYIEDGKFVARCVPNPFKATDNVDMISGGIQTYGKFSVRYGKIEARLLTNGHTGNFPAFWMMPQDNSAGWPYGGEIDIWEQINNENVSYHTIHSRWANGTSDGSLCQGQGNNPKKGGTKSNVTTGNYHTFTLEWNEKLLTWYVDGIKAFSYAKSSKQSDLDLGQWPFDKAFHIIINQSVGNGSWAANCDTGHVYETLFDWVRVYQTKDQMSTGIVTVPEESLLKVNVTKGQINVSASKPMMVSVYDLYGRCLSSEKVSGDKAYKMNHGIYFVNNTKVLVP